MQVQVSQYLDLRHLGMHICCVLNCKYHMYVDVNQRFCKQLGGFCLNKHPQQSRLPLVIPTAHRNVYLGHFQRTLCI